MSFGMIRPAWLRPVWLTVAIFVAGVACETLSSPVAAPDGAPTPDVESAVRAVIGSVESTPQPTLNPTVNSTLRADEEIDIPATIIASVQATVEALRAATPIPSPTPTGVPAAQLAPAQVTSGNDLPTPTVTAATATAPTPGPTQTLVPTPTAQPTPSPTPVPQPTLVAGCAAVANGTQIAAWIDGQTVASAGVQDGVYTIFVDQGDGSTFSGKTVTFKIGSLDANESGNWVQGGASELNLTAAPADTTTSQLEPDLASETTAAIRQPQHPPRGGPLAQRVPPHVFVGTATIVC